MSSRRPTSPTKTAKTVLDTFIAAVRFMEGEPKKPWWKYTAERKKVLAAREAASN